MDPTILFTGSLFFTAMYGLTRSPVYGIAGLILLLMGLAADPM